MKLRLSPKNNLEATANIVPLKEVTYETFKEFLDSLDEERETWSLDLQTFKNDKEWYDKMIYSIVCVYDGEIIGLLSTFERWDLQKETIEVSFVVKKDYQSQGIGSTLLKRVEYDTTRISTYKYIIARHFKDNIASHKAFLKAGYKEWKEHKNLVWKIKFLRRNFKPRETYWK